MTTNLVPTNQNKFYCKLCNYSSSRKSQYDRHLLTSKHKNNENTTKIQQMKNENSPFICSCGKKYAHRASLYNHKKNCNYSQELNLVPNQTELSGELIIKLINENNQLKNTILKENKELRNQITELIPRIGNNNNNIKQKFNINVFLNEKCKDAISMDEFIEKIDISLKNLLTTSEKGQTEGISNIIIENINKLSLYERPIHCTDKKRETLYIKNNEWEHDEKLEHVDKMIKQVEHKQLQNIKKWIDEHPNYEKSEKEKDEFTVMLRECSKSIDDGREKVIKNLCGELFVDKE